MSWARKMGRTHSAQSTLQRLQCRMSRPRVVRYLFIATAVLLFIMFRDGEHFIPVMSRYMPSHEDSQRLIAIEDKAQPKQETEKSIEEHSPDSLSSTAWIASEKSFSQPKRFGKITASYDGPDQAYGDAIKSHVLHNELYGYSHFILREHVIPGLWSKHAWIMTVIGQELAKPEDQRLEWVLWHDHDTVVMNPQIPLSIFVPPEPQFSNIHLLVTKDRNGLNNGVFMVRVSQWAFKLFASALSIREYQPELPLRYTEQSAMEAVIRRPWWATSVAYVPHYWFNGFIPSDNNLDFEIARPGSLLIHFASNRDGLRPERLRQWSSFAKENPARWNKHVNNTGYLQEISEYWTRLANGETMASIVQSFGGRSWLEWEK